MQNLLLRGETESANLYVSRPQKICDLAHLTENLLRHK